MKIHVLGTAQDGGYPHAGCTNKCCLSAWDSPSLHRLPSSISIIDNENKKFYLFDISPDIKIQLAQLNIQEYELSGIFITHAHIGHYLGLMSLGLEIMNTKKIPVYVMPRMKNFILNNEPTNQLILNKNISIIDLINFSPIILNDLSVTPFEVPHRNELSETVGFKIMTRDNSVIYLPDIDDWGQWDVDLCTLVKDNDILFLDGTFYNKKEINLRDISRIPHPEIIDTMQRLNKLKKSIKKKVHFIHFNHTNEVIKGNGDAYKHVVQNGFNILNDNQIFNI